MTEYLAEYARYEEFEGSMIRSLNDIENSTHKAISELDLSDTIKKDMLLSLTDMRAYISDMVVNVRCEVKNSIADRQEELDGHDDESEVEIANELWWRLQNRKEVTANI